MNKRDHDFLTRLELLRAIDERISLLDDISCEFDYLEEDTDRLTRELLDLTHEIETDILEYLETLVAEVKAHAKKACASL